MVWSVDSGEGGRRRGVRWGHRHHLRISAPLHPVRNPPHHPKDAIGAPILEVTLEVGDVLYMPRGTVHQAVAQSDGGALYGW